MYYMLPESYEAYLSNDTIHMFLALLFKTLWQVYVKDKEHVYGFGTHCISGQYIPLQ